MNGRPVAPARILLPASPRAIVLTLTLAVLSFSFIHLAAVIVESQANDPRYFQRFRLQALRRHFDLEQEYNLTTWYSSATLLFCAYLLRLIARHERVAGKAGAGHWDLLAVGFLCMSMDETAMLHEATTGPLTRMLNPSGIFYYAWVILAVPVLIAVVLMNVNFLRALPSRTRHGFIVAGVTFVAGAVGLEMVEGVIATRQGDPSLAMTLARSFEEILEMTGVLLFVRALLRHMADHLPGSVEVPGVAA